jgi:hypothetical protein
MDPVCILQQNCIVPPREKFKHIMIEYFTFKCSRDIQDGKKLKENERWEKLDFYRSL